MPIFGADYLSKLKLRKLSNTTVLHALSKFLVDILTTFNVMALYTLLLFIIGQYL